MAIYTGYFDDSSDEEQPYFVLGGIILDAEIASDFDQDWRQAIKALPLLDGQPFLHTTDFVSGNGQYDPAWKGRYEEKLTILTDAARVISKYSLQVVTSVVNMEHYRVFDTIVKMSEAIGHPFTVATRLAYQHMQLWANRNSITTPVKMVLETRKGIGDVVEMFRINGDPIPAFEGKGLPQLQAADYIAWMRLKKHEPNSSYQKVKDSWREINKSLYIDEPWGFNGLMKVFERLAEQHPETAFPLRKDDRTKITFNRNFKNPRRPFKRTAHPRQPDSE